MAGHDRAHVGEVDVDDTGDGDQVGDALRRVLKHFVREGKGLHQARVVRGDLKQTIVGNRDEGVDRLLELADPLFGEAHPSTALEAEGLGDHADCECTALPRDLSDDRSRSSTRAAAHTGGHEDHVRTLECFTDLVDALECSLSALLGVRPRTESSRDASTQLDRRSRTVSLQSLNVGVRGDELDALDVGRDHGVHRVSASSTDPDHLDLCLVLKALVQFEVRHSCSFFRVRSDVKSSCTWNNGATDPSQKSSEFIEALSFTLYPTCRIKQKNGLHAVNACRMASTQSAGIDRLSHNSRALTPCHKSIGKPS